MTWSRARSRGEGLEAGECHYRWRLGSVTLECPMLEACVCDHVWVCGMQIFEGRVCCKYWITVFASLVVEKGGVVQERVSLGASQGYLAHEKYAPLRTLQQGYA